MRLIDADALKKEIHRYALDVYCINLENSKEFAGYSTGENYCEGLYEATELIDNLPTIDAEPVRHGHWHRIKLSAYPYGAKYVCSCCKVEALTEEDSYSDYHNYVLSNYCPNCGAKMDEVSE